LLSVDDFALPFLDLVVSFIADEADDGGEDDDGIDDRADNLSSFFFFGIG